jgi:hypothetical protein
VAEHVAGDPLRDVFAGTVERLRDEQRVPLAGCVAGGGV